jgi:hypothetical protein
VAVVVAGASTGIAWLTHGPAASALASLGDQSRHRDDQVAPPVPWPTGPRPTTRRDRRRAAPVGPQGGADVNDDISAGTVAMPHLGRAD